MSFLGVRSVGRYLLSPLSLEVKDFWRVCRQAFCILIQLIDLLIELVCLYIFFEGHVWVL